MKSDVDRDALQEVLGDLETRLEAYLVEWRRLHGIEDRDARPASSPKSSVRQPPSGEERCRDPRR
jgi:hypothetical protein